MDNQFNIELISNLYITFYFMKPSNYTETNYNEINFDNIIQQLNLDEKIYLKYSINTINCFTLFLNKLLNKYLNMFSKNDRLNICILNNIVINPQLI